jgi:hypothetical protein
LADNIPSPCCGPGTLPSPFDDRKDEDGREDGEESRFDMLPPPPPPPLPGCGFIVDDGDDDDDDDERRGGPSPTPGLDGSVRGGRPGGKRRIQPEGSFQKMNFNRALLYRPHSLVSRRVHSSPAQANSPTQHGDCFRSRQGWSICFDGCI